MLREFVYLDEVSVYSLIASRLGPIAAEFTETQTASLQDEVTSSIGAGPGLVKTEVKSRALATQNHGSKVLRKSIVQTTFKELYELEVDSLGMRPMPEDLKPPTVHSLDDLITLTKRLESEGWIIDPANLARGQLLEVEVQLEAEAIFRFSAVVSALLEIIDEDSELFGLDSHDNLVQAKSIDRIIDRLLVGLVPIRGQSTEYGVVKFGEKEWIVHRTLFGGIKDTESPPMRPLYVVGVAEQSLFWKDIRRILFSQARFRVLCRMAQDGLNDSWTPVKLVHVLDSVAPDLASQINFAGSGALATISRYSASNSAAEIKRKLIRDALVNYARLLTEHYRLNVTPEDSDHVVALSDHHCASFGSLNARREAFDAIVTFLVARFGVEREPLVTAQYRAVALEDAGLDISGQPVEVIASHEVRSDVWLEERFLDTEFVAIYW